MRQDGTQTFAFDGGGALSEDARATVVGELAFWVHGLDERERDELRDWIETGRIPESDRLLRRVLERLRRDVLQEPDMYARTVCRLVYSDQLFLPAVPPHFYQLTPAQSSLMMSSREGHAAAISELDGLTPTREAYAGISATMQSAVAMFDSDLGRKDDGRHAARCTKELIRVYASDTVGGRGWWATPRELNSFSTSRYWAPPRVFFDSVVHLLLWRGVLTRYDLYGREVRGDTPQERAAQYYIAVNRYNSSKFRVTEYAEIFEFLWRLAQAVGRNGTDKDIELPADDACARWPAGLEFESAAQCKVVLPFATLRAEGARQFDLIRPYAAEGDQTSQFLRFFRDRALEAILWSRYQVEIRSVGMVPIGDLYQLELNEDAFPQDLFASSEEEHRFLALFSQKRRGILDVTAVQRLDAIGNRISTRVHDATVSGEIAEWLLVRHVYDGRQRTASDERAAGTLVNVHVPRDRSVPADWSVRIQSHARPRSERQRIYGSIEYLRCLDAMHHYYRGIYETAQKLTGIRDVEHAIGRWSTTQTEIVRRHINTELENYVLEFFVQRVQWANLCRRAHEDKGVALERHLADARLDPLRHPCQMRVNSIQRYSRGEDCLPSYEEFLSESSQCLLAIHSHLVSINRSLSQLYRYLTHLPFADWTPAGRSEVATMLDQLEHIMRGLLIATHLQAQKHWQRDIVNYLVTVRSDCDRFFETLPRYFQNHRLRLVRRSRNQPQFPLHCLPEGAGPYRDFLSAFENTAHHTRAVIHWSIRQHAVWYNVPPQILDAIGPTHL